MLGRAPSAAFCHRAQLRHAVRTQVVRLLRRREMPTGQRMPALRAGCARTRPPSSAPARVPPKRGIPFWEVMNRLLEACGAWFDVWDLIYTLN
jgi:hypothetical protein